MHLRQRGKPYYLCLTYVYTLKLGKAWGKRQRGKGQRQWLRWKGRMLRDVLKAKAKARGNEASCYFVIKILGARIERHKARGKRHEKGPGATLRAKGLGHLDKHEASSGILKA